MVVAAVISTSSLSFHLCWPPFSSVPWQRFMTFAIGWFFGSNHCPSVEDSFFHTFLTCAKVRDGIFIWSKSWLYSNAAERIRRDNRIVILYWTIQCIRNNCYNFFRKSLKYVKTFVFISSFLTYSKFTFFFSWRLWQTDVSLQENMYNILVLLLTLSKWEISAVIEYLSSYKVLTI